MSNTHLQPQEISIPTTIIFSRLILLREVEVAYNLSQDKQMVNEKELSIKAVFCSQPICRAEQRNMTQADGLLGKVIEYRWLWIALRITES